MKASGEFTLNLRLENKQNYNTTSLKPYKYYLQKYCPMPSCANFTNTKCKKKISKHLFVYPPSPLNKSLQPLMNQPKSFNCQNLHRRLCTAAYCCHSRLTASASPPPHLRGDLLQPQRS